MVSWIKIDVARKSSLPPLSEVVCMYSKAEGFFFGSVTDRTDTLGRTIYYYQPDRYSIERKSGARALRGKKIWWCFLDEVFGWKRMYVSKKDTLPPLDTLIAIYSPKAGRFFGMVKKEQSLSGRNEYYIHAGRSVLRIKGNHYEWQAAPEIPFGSRF